MKLSELKNHLVSLENITIQLPSGIQIPSHFHVTEVGKQTKHFMDCGGLERLEETISLQLWVANDTDHRLTPERFLSIINQSETQLGLRDSSIEVHYQGETIGVYNLERGNNGFQLSNTQTDCLAKDACGIPEIKPRVKLSDMLAKAETCAPNSGCC